MSVPTFGAFDARRLAALARSAEQAGWDGFFCWDHMLWDPLDTGLTDTTVALTAVALATDRVLFGPLVSPLARRRPWKLAREVATLDRLSGGRLVLGVGTGDDVDFVPVGDPAPAVHRAAILDEAIDLLRRFLEDDEPVQHHGAAYTVDAVRLRPQPVQRRIPLWAGGWWPRPRPFLRAARLDGVFPLNGQDTERMLSASALTECLDFVSQHRGVDVRLDAAYAVAVAGRTDGLGDDRPAEYFEHGATWWIEGIDPWRDDVDAAGRRIAAGPPPL